MGFDPIEFRLACLFCLLETDERTRLVFVRMLVTHHDTLYRVE